ncbi:MAG: two-component system, NarL family, sensor kinase [Gaiellales bacterium]|nr:two-component system, NarL family, sensor kinase [Gaiellales bacterium]
MRRAVFRFMVTSLGAIVVLAAVAVYLQQRIGERAAIRTGRESATLITRGIVEPVLTERGLAGPGPDRAALDRIIRTRVLDRTIVRVKIWDRDGTILYSDDPRLIGARYPLGADEVAVLATGGTAADISDLSAPENRLERNNERLLEVYRPVRVAPTGRLVLFEFYKRFDEASVSTLRVWRTSALFLLGAVALIWLLQVPLAWSLARRLRAGHEERERLLQRAVDASKIERGRIASDLHDGVVPQLAGTAYSLAAAARSTATVTRADSASAMDECAGTVREAMQQLRSLIVEIHPPQLESAGLAGVLENLAAGVSSSGLAVDVDVEPGLRFPAETEQMLFRAAQEGLRNIINHAQATHASVTVKPDAGSVQLLVSDNGIGFTAVSIAQRRASGHLGLELLAELASDAGGHLEMESQPGIGTTLRLRMPGR